MITGGRNPVADTYAMMAMADMMNSDDGTKLNREFAGDTKNLILWVKKTVSKRNVRKLGEFREKDLPIILNLTHEKGMSPETLARFVIEKSMVGDVLKGLLFHGLLDTDAIYVTIEYPVIRGLRKEINQIQKEMNNEFKGARRAFRKIRKDKYKNEYFEEYDRRVVIIES